MAFWHAVHDDERLTWLGVDDKHVFVGGSRNRFYVTPDGIENSPWNELLGVFLGERPPRILTQISRVVGYFSQVHNWNRSKKAELVDRRKGVYDLSDVSEMVHEPLPKVVTEALAFSGGVLACDVDLHDGEESDV